MDIKNSIPSSDSGKTRFSLYPVLICLVAVLLFIVISVITYWPLQEKAFLSDNSPVSWLSSAQLWGLAFLSLRLGIDRTLNLSLSTWLTLAMLIMAFDEQFMAHEHWKYGCSDWFKACSYHWVRELPMILIAVAGVITAMWLHAAIPSRARVVLWLSLATGGLAIVVDLTLTPYPLVPYEEGLEVIAEMLFTGLLLGVKRTANKE